jgi:rRNA-processing protein FCF1
LKTQYSRERPIIKAVIDASPLFTALVLELVENSPESHRKTILERSALPLYLASPSRRWEFVQLFRSIPTILTTSQVIAEVNGLLKRESIKGERYRAFWTHGMDLMNAKRLDERSLLRLLDMYVVGALKEGVCTIGPVDTALIDLARGEGCALLTDDTTLAWRAWDLGVDCRLVDKLIS